MAGLEDVEAWLDASDKNGVGVFDFDSALTFASCKKAFPAIFLPQDGALSFEEFKFAFVGTNMINL